MVNMADTPEQDSDELRKRRERLEALKSKRAGAPPAPAPAAEPADDAQPDIGMGGAMGPGGVFGGMGGPGGKRNRQRKLLMKVYKVLTQTPADDEGLVPDTPFTATGVARLMEMLRTRAEDPSATGAKIAGGLLNFISPGKDETATSSGASVEKLQMLARRIEAIRGAAGAAPKARW